MSSGLAGRGRFSALGMKHGITPEDLRAVVRTTMEHTRIIINLKEQNISQTTEGNEQMTQQKCNRSKNSPPKQQLHHHF